MKFNAPITVLQVKERTFQNKKGETVEYTSASVITAEGDILQVSSSPEVLEVIGEKRRIDVEATFEVLADFNGKAKLRLANVALAKGKA